VTLMLDSNGKYVNFNKWYAIGSKLWFVLREYVSVHDILSTNMRILSQWQIK
jgi:hypothetical protein